MSSLQLEKHFASRAALCVEETSVKKVQIKRFGVPEEVAECVEYPGTGLPDADEVVFDVLAFPINPADIAFCQGNYRLKPMLPATPGAEGVGQIVAVGDAVRGVRLGDLVICLDR
jgi:mitochondrial enoyl-[acyl-carrier protein] reductase / trans-2-enoyl-CoA reductase